MKNPAPIIDKLQNGTIDFNDSKFRAAYALNLCTVSVSQIIDYNDIVVLEQEYEAILNNLNIEMMPKDEALLNILKQLLDTITFFRIQDGDKKFIEREYQNKIKNAIWSAVPNFGLIVSGGNIATMAASLASQVGIGYMNYRKAKAENAFAYEKSMWQLQRAAIEQFNGLRRELFDTAWRLVDAHELPDEFRLTERQVKQYNEILMDPDDYRRYERLDTIKENFLAYPPFWYFFGNTANTLSRSGDVLTSNFYTEAAKTYYEVFVQSFKSCNLLRENQIASACALEYIDLLDPAVQAERDKIDELLSFAIKMSGNANDVLQLCAFAYLKLGDANNAAIILRRLVNENYNTVVNAQLLSGYYVSSIVAGNGAFRNEYRYLQDRIDDALLFPLPNEILMAPSNKDTISNIQATFISNQKEILTKKFGIVINSLQEKYRVLFNQCIPVPGKKEYTSEYYGNSNEAYAARKADGLILRSKKSLGNYIGTLQDCDYPYNYLNVLNEMINSVSTLNCVQGCESALLTCVSNSIICNRRVLKDIKDKIDDGSKFTADTYSDMLEISFDDFSDQFFNLLAQYSSEYIEHKNDIVSMNEAELNLREFCLQQGFESPDILYETANDVKETNITKKQYLGMELIDDGVLSSVINDRFDEIKSAIQPFANCLCKNTLCSFYTCEQQEFDRYFIDLGVPSKRDIRRKTIAILDDNSSKDSDLLFTTDGIMQVIKGKVKTVIPYDDIELSADNKAVLLHQSYSNINVNMSNLIQMILILRSEPFAVTKGKKNPLDLIVSIIKK